MYHACSNSRYTNEIHAQAKSGRAKRAPLLVCAMYNNSYTVALVHIEVLLLAVFLTRYQRHVNCEFAVKLLLLSFHQYSLKNAEGRGRGLRLTVASIPCSFPRRAIGKEPTLG